VKRSVPTLAVTADCPSVWIDNSTASVKRQVCESLRGQRHLNTTPPIDLVLRQLQSGLPQLGKTPCRRRRQQAASMGLLHSTGVPTSLSCSVARKIMTQIRKTEVRASTNEMRTQIYQMLRNKGWRTIASKQSRKQSKISVGEPVCVWENESDWANVRRWRK